MKIRNGFVSNSSSSSFVLDTNYLSEDQVNKIKEYITSDCPDYWSIDKEDNILRLCAHMDNGYLFAFIRELNPPMKAIVEWEV